MFLLTPHVPPGYLEEYLVLACRPLQWINYDHPNPGEAFKVSWVNFHWRCMAVVSSLSGSCGDIAYFECLKLAVRNSSWMISPVTNRPWDFVSQLWIQTTEL